MIKRLKIHSALYVCQGWSKNVKGILKDNITEWHTLTLPVLNEYLGGEFYPGHQKELWITYTYDGISESLKLKEGEILVIPPRLQIPEKISLLKRLLNYLKTI